MTTMQQQTIESPSLAAAILLPTAKTPKKVDEKKLSYSQAIAQMISQLLEIESAMLNSEMKDQENQSKMGATAAVINKEISAQEEKEVKKQEAAVRSQHHHSFFGSIFHAILGVATIVIGGLVGGPLGLAMATALFALSMSGGLDKMMDAMHINDINNPFARFAAKMGVLLTISAIGAGAGFALGAEEVSGQAVADGAEEAVANGAEQGAEANGNQATQTVTRGARAKAYGKFTAASFLPAVNPTGDLFTGLFVGIAKITGGSEKAAKEAAQILANVANVILSFYAMYRMKGNDVLKMEKFSTENPRMLSRISTVAHLTAVGSGIGESVSTYQVGKALQEQASILRDMAKTKYANSLMENIAKLAGEMVQRSSNKISALTDEFAEENSGFKVYQAPMLAAAQAV